MSIHEQKKRKKRTFDEGETEEERAVEIVVKKKRKNGKSSNISENVGIARKDLEENKKKSAHNLCYTDTAPEINVKKRMSEKKESILEKKLTKDKKTDKAIENELSKHASFSDQTDKQKKKKRKEANQIGLHNSGDDCKSEEISANLHKLPCSKTEKKSKKKLPKVKNNDEATENELTEPATSSDQTDKQKKKKRKEANKIGLQNSGDGCKDEEISANLHKLPCSKTEKKNKKKRDKEKTTEKNTEEDKKSASKLACDYLHEWKSHRSKWHFQKVRQVWLLQHMYSILVSDDDFEIMLEYLEGVKGQARTKTLADAEEVMKVSEEADVADDAGDSETSLKLDRARKLIQLLG